MLLFALLVFLQLAVLGVFVWIGMRVGIEGRAPYQDPPSKTATPDGGTVPPPVFTTEPTGEPTGEPRTTKPADDGADAGTTAGVVVAALAGLVALAGAVIFAVRYYNNGQGGVPEAEQAAQEYVNALASVASIPRLLKSGRKQAGDLLETARQEKQKVEKFVTTLADERAGDAEKNIARMGITDSLTKMSDLYNKASRIARLYVDARNARPRYERERQTTQTADITMMK